MTHECAICKKTIREQDDLYIMNCFHTKHDRCRGECLECFPDDNFDLSNPILNVNELENELENAKNTKDDSNDMYIPLQFWFNRDPSLALPMVALQHPKYKLDVKDVSYNPLRIMSGMEVLRYST